MNGLTRVSARPDPLKRKLTTLLWDEEREGQKKSPDGTL